MARIPNSGLFILIFALTVLIYLYTFINDYCIFDSCNARIVREGILDGFLRNDSNATRISIASVICSKNGDTGPREEAAVMITSVLISTILYKILADIEFHLFLEHKEDEEYFQTELKTFGDPLQYARVSLHFYSALDAVPEKYRESLINHASYRCMYDRIFLSNILSDIDSILYLDTDTIIAGNIMELWNHFSQMNDEQLVGVAQDIDEQCPQNSSFFKDIPFPKPKGLNSGIQLMNLTKMREYGWEEKLMRLYEDYAVRGRVKMNDQKLLNILLYFDSGIWIRLPCQFNYWLRNCFEGNYCDGASQDPKGIQVVHGATNGFNDGHAFREIFTGYQAFKLRNDTSIRDIKQELMLKIRTEFQLPATGQKKYPNHGECDGTIGSLLFKEYFVK